MAIMPDSYQTLHKRWPRQSRLAAADDELQPRAHHQLGEMPAPPPLPVEINTCNEFCARSRQMPRARGILRWEPSHAANLRRLRRPNSGSSFAHAEHTQRSGAAGFCHCSRYNTQTRRLTTAMFEGPPQSAELPAARKE